MTAQLLQVLLVEDSLPDIELTLGALADAKVANQVHVVRDGEQALDFLHRRGEYAEAARPDLVLLDLNLPRVSGHEVLGEIKSSPGLRSIPVAVLTTSETEHDVLRSYELGVNCYLTKPVDLTQFLRVVQQIEDFWFGMVRLPKQDTR